MKFMAFVLFVVVCGLGIYLPLAIYGTSALGNWFFYVYAFVLFVTIGARAVRMGNGEFQR